MRATALPTDATHFKATGAGARFTSSCSAGAASASTRPRKGRMAAVRVVMRMMIMEGVCERRRERRGGRESATGRDARLTAGQTCRAL